MSFALDCKKEIMNIRRTQELNAALAFGMLFAGSRKTLDEIIFYSANFELAEYCEFVFKKGYKLEGYRNETKMTNEMLSVAEFHIKKDVWDIDSEANKEFLNTLIDKENVKSAFLAGAFIARGSVNDPVTAKYHIEFSLKEPDMAVFVQRLVNSYEFNSKIVKRRNRYIVYIKDAEKVVDLLRIMGASSQAFTFEDYRIERDFSNSINRVINCEVHNEEKSMNAAKEQLKYLKYLEYNYPLEKLDQKLLLVMKVRYDNPEATLNELCTIIKEQYGENISKPGLSHRFAKLKEIAIEHNKNKL